MYNYKLVSFGSVLQTDRIWLMANGVMFGQVYRITFRADMVLLVDDTVQIAMPKSLWERCVWECRG